VDFVKLIELAKDLGPVATLIAVLVLYYMHRTATTVLKEIRDEIKDIGSEVISQGGKQDRLADRVDAIGNQSSHTAQRLEGMASDHLSRLEKIVERVTRVEERIKIPIDD